MTTKLGTQKERIRARLHKYGRISRNECLRNFITRCAARIADLEEEGYVFRTYPYGGDYLYVLVSIKGESFTPEVAALPAPDYQPTK
jgi:hypothetical protein